MHCSIVLAAISTSGLASAFLVNRPHLNRRDLDSDIISAREKYESSLEKFYSGNLDSETRAYVRRGDSSTGTLEGKGKEKATEMTSQRPASSKSDGTEGSGFSMLSDVSGVAYNGYKSKALVGVSNTIVSAKKNPGPVIDKAAAALTATFNAAALAAAAAGQPYITGGLSMAGASVTAANNGVQAKFAANSKTKMPGQITPAGRIAKDKRSLSARQIDLESLDKLYRRELEDEELAV